MLLQGSGSNAHLGNCSLPEFILQRANSEEERAMHKIGIKSELDSIPIPMHSPHSLRSHLPKYRFWQTMTDFYGDRNGLYIRSLLSLIFGLLMCPWVGVTSSSYRGLVRRNFRLILGDKFKSFYSQNAPVRRRSRQNTILYDLGVFVTCKNCLPHQQDYGIEIEKKKP